MSGAHNFASTHGKAQTQGRCVFTGLAGADGMHWYPANDFTLLADVPENIFAGVRNHHSVRGKPCFDWLQRDGVDIVRPVDQRKWMLENLTLDEFRPIIHRKIRIVGLWCEKHGYDFPDAKRPEDYEALIYQGRLT